MSFWHLHLNSYTTSAKICENLLSKGGGPGTSKIHMVFKGVSQKTCRFTRYEGEGGKMVQNPSTWLMDAA